MKLLFGILLMGLLGSFSISDKPELKNKTKENNCGCSVTKFKEEHLKSYPLSENDTIKIKELTDDEIKSIRNKLCMNIITATSFGFKSSDFKKVILEGLGQNLNVSNANQIVSDFLNTNKQKLVCPRDKTRKNSRDLHVYKSAILGGVIDLYDEILLDDDEYEIDLNAYEIVDGKKETVVDYIDKLIESGQYDKENMELLRDDIIDMGGKRGAEL